MQDQYDRRELLLHLGDMLRAVRSATRAGSPDALIGELAAQQEPLQDFKVLHMAAPTMTVAESLLGPLARSTVGQRRCLKRDSTTMHLYRRSRVTYSRAIMTAGTLT